MVFTTEICGNYVMGLNFKLDVGLYQLDRQVACQRIGTILDAEKTSSLTAMVNKALGLREQALVPALA